MSKRPPRMKGALYQSTLDIWYALSAEDRALAADMTPGQHLDLLEHTIDGVTVRVKLRRTDSGKLRAHVAANHHMLIDETRKPNAG